MLKILLVDDEESILHAYRKVLRHDRWTLLTASTGAEAEAIMSKERLAVVVLDVNLPDGRELEVFERLQRQDARVPIILVTGHGTTDLAIEAIKRGAFDYLLKPLELEALRELIHRAIDISQRMQAPAALPEEPVVGEFDDRLIGRCPAMQAVYKQIGRVAAQDVSVLIVGESGTGKELVARSIYQHSHRSNKPFLAINCAAIPENLLESELFGHERGAFTGADRKRIGKFEQCHGGTILLDEVGEMPPLTQSKMLRLLQEQRFERVGGNETVRTDVRLIAATNADLAHLVESGRFRGDLHFRIKVFTIAIPPLRERGEDLELLVDHYLRRYCHELGRPPVSLNAAALARLSNHSWPGNVRELQSVLKQAVLNCRGGQIESAELRGLIGASETFIATPPANDVARLMEEAWERFVCD
ncbi:MAG: sigma-54-dependent transcriptional regulator, partial [Planctomycetaceae bacterium]